MSEKYKVKKGDNLTKIAREKGVSLQELIDANPQVKDPNLIITGEKLNVPNQTNQTSSESGVDSETPKEFNFSDPSGVEEQSGSGNEQETSESSEQLIKTDKKYHIPEELRSAFDGQGSNHLEEPVPNFKQRAGDYTIQPPIDNNTIIVFGRDRSPFRENEDGFKEDFKASVFRDQQISGYSNYMGAGAIDIVVGRGAPYPLDKITDTTSPNGRPLNLPPLYLTRDDLGLRGQDLRDGFKHPGYAMDAARIYISQMSQIDDYFNIAKPFDTADFGPCSSIMLKADKIRLHSRRDIKIVAGGDIPSGTSIGGRHDSNGFEIIDTPSIHLIAGNGNLNNQQPIPLGYNLANCLESIIDQNNSILTILGNFLKAQRSVNEKVSSAVYPIPAGGTTAKNPFVVFENLVFQCVAAQELTQIHFTQMNFNSITNNYLRSSGPRRITSGHNTTN